MNKTKKMLEVEERIGEDLGEYLRREYVGKLRFASDVATDLGIDQNIMKKWLVRLGINIRTRSESNSLKSRLNGKTKKMLEVEARIGELIEVYLRREYGDRHRSVLELEEELGVSHLAVYNWLDEFKIKKRTVSEALLPKGFVKPSEKRLRYLYLNEGKTPKEIADEFGTSDSTIRNLLDEYGISRRSILEAKRLQAKRMEGKKSKRMLEIEERIGEDLGEYLGREYESKNRSTVDIAEELEVASGTVGNWLNWFGIDSRDSRGKYDSRDKRKEDTDRLLEILNKEPSELFTSDFVKKLREDGHSYYSVLGWYKRKHHCAVGEARDILLEDLYRIQREDQDSLDELVEDYLQDE